MPDQKLVSLQTVMHTIQEVFDATLSGRQFWCQAEVLQAKLHKGRVYLELVEYDATGIVLAKARGIIRQREIVDQYLAASGIGVLESLPGKIIMFEWTCRFHQQRGLSISILSLSAEFTRGQLVQQQAALRAALQQQGIYGRNKQQQLSCKPLRLAIISSVNSQWLNDFLSILQESEYHISWDLFAASIHGEAAKKDVASQLVAIANCYETQWYTALVIVRGGGGGEWLLRQNDPDIAAAVCQMPLPVLLATGHTSDTSVLDELVRYAAKTPTDAAYLLVGILADRDKQFDDLYMSIQGQCTAAVKRLTSALNELYQDIEESIQISITTISQTIHHAREVICGCAPDQVLKKWYAALQNLQWTYLTRTDIDTLERGDLLQVQTATKTWVVRIEEEIF